MSRMSQDLKNEQYDVSDINLLISDTDIKLIMSRKESIKCLARRIVGVRRYMTTAEFERQASNLYKCCLKGVKDMHELHRRRVTGMQIIDDIILRADPNYISVQNVIHIVWSIMSCIHHFQLRLRTGSTGIVYYARRRKANHCMESYSKLLRMFKPSMHRIILNSVMTFYKEGKLWEIEFACTDLVMNLLLIYVDVEEAINDILNMAQQASLTNETEAKHLIQVLYELMTQIRWRSMSETLMARMLTMLKSSIMPEENGQYNYVPLRMGIELCIRNTINNLQNKDLLNMLFIAVQQIDNKRMDEAALLDIGNIAAYAANRFKVKTFYQKFKPGLLESIFRLSISTKSVAIFVSARIWLNLIDRSNNAAKLRTPRVYFQDCNYNIVINKCSRKDKQFIKGLRHSLYQVGLQSFIYSYKVCELETVFQASALTLVEIPCGHSASTHIAVALSLQEYAFKLSSDNLVKSHHLHATVLSLLSLICYIHKAEILYKYVMVIMERRADWAPYLNPPLKPTYQYAQHHILWNKPELFFEDWEVRYGLWKCFRLKKKRHKKVIEFS